jgi:TolB-like protein
MSLIHELRRRHVFRVGILYAVVAWLLLQVVDVIAPMLSLPDWAGRLILLLLLVGFPIALIFAWAFDLTPQGIQRDSGAGEEIVTGKRGIFDAVVFVTLVLGLGYFAWSRLADDTDQERAATRDGATVTNMASPADSPAGTSIAVLPFVNMSADADQEYFSDGISEELLNALTGIPGLRVASRTSAFAFKGENRNIREIASILGVNHILEGSVRKSGNRVRITAQLIDTTNDTHLWSETYDRELDDIFAIQDEISNAIVDSLTGTLGVAASVTIAPPTTDMDAYDLYLKALSFNAVLSLDTRSQQLELLEQAVALDPEFAAGWAQLAEILAVIPTWDHGLDMVDYMARARDAAERALAIEPDNQTAILAIARAAYESHDWETWKEFVQEKIPSDPDVIARDANLSGTLSEQWLGLGYLVKALEIADKALAINPDNSFLNLIRGLVALDLGRKDEALPYIKNAILFGYSGSAEGLVWSHYGGDYAEAIWVASTSTRFAAHDPSLLPLMPHIRRLVFSTREDRQAEIARFWTVANELGFSREDLLGPGPQWGRRLDDGILVTLGEFLPVVDNFWGNSPMFWMWTRGLWSLRQSEEFRSRIRDSKMLAFWQENGWPDLCRPTDKDGFECD